jgi:hypothetical protein
MIVQAPSPETPSTVLARRVGESLGLPEDAAAVVVALLLELGDGISLDELVFMLRRPIGRLGSSIDRLRRLGAIERGVRHIPALTRGTPGIRDLIRNLAAAYRSGGMEAHCSSPRR